MSELTCVCLLLCCNLKQGRHVLNHDHLLICDHDYRKTTNRIPMKLGWRMGLGPESTSLTFGEDSDKGINPGVVFFYKALIQ